VYFGQQVPLFLCLSASFISEITEQVSKENGIAEVYLKRCWTIATAAFAEMYGT
jgi:hypothetical protein